MVSTYLIQRYCKRAERKLAFDFPSAAYLIQRYCKVRATARRENAVLPDLTLPSRSISYAKILIKIWFVTVQRQKIRVLKQ